MAKNKITQKAKQEYLKSPNHCPFCGSQDISAQDHDSEGCKVTCNDCGKAWVELFKIVDIIEIN